MTATYTCGTMRPIHVGDSYDQGRLTVERMDDAAMAFATRVARRTYGRRGSCHHVRQDGRAVDGSYVNFEAFIGVPAQGGGMSGQNVWLTIWVAEGRK